MSQLERVNNAIKCPERLTADDGRVFYITRWAPVAEVVETTTLIRITAEMVVKDSKGWVTQEARTE